MLGDCVQGMLLTVQKSLCCTAFESIESANSLRFLWIALSIESAGLSIESVHAIL